jgi:hypothetical protein
MQAGGRKEVKLFAPEIYVDASLAKPTPRTSPVALNRVFPQSGPMVQNSEDMVSRGTPAQA